MASLITRTQICPLIFADIARSSKITDDRLKADLNRFIQSLLDETNARFQVVLTKHTGDGFLICGTDATEMAEAALSARDRFRNMDWLRRGYSEPVAIRIGVDLQKVTLIEQGGVVNDVSGAGVDRAARIEPVVSENEVWCSDHFVGQLRHEHVHNIIDVPVGLRQLAKGAGEVALYALHWAHEASARSTTPETVRHDGKATAVSLPRLKRRIADAEKDQFATDSLPRIAAYFRRALELLEQHQSPHVQCRFDPNSPTRFSAEIYVDGESRQQCTIWLVSQGREIRYAYGRAWMGQQDNAFNESLRVDDDGIDIFFRPLGMLFMDGNRGPLDPDQAAEYLWNAFTRYLS